ncbi:MAG: hypothetical protein GVY12_17530 [Bacteroidetes bacterium]|jgi:16S rRNA U1498 N3-methylase RsmE|nr:hypothetical protein [Bacteroidota bacterium]
MQPPEFILVMALVLCGTFLSWYLLSNIFGYLGGRRSAKSDIKLSELQAIVELAVEQANKPLIQRIEQLERIVEQHHTLPPRRQPLLDEDEFLAAAEQGEPLSREQTASGV